MRIGILGAGDMAEALGTQWTRQGHELMIATRTNPAPLATRLEARTGSYAEAAAFGQVLLLAVPAAAALDVLTEAGAAGRTVIDCTNPVAPDWTLTTKDISLAEQLATTGAHVVKAFNLCHVDTWRLTPPVFADRPLAVPLCGDDPTALAQVQTLVRDLGCDPVVAGPLSRAGLLEATAAFVIGLWMRGADAQAILPPLG
ncbi:NADPH-dependent F420 reductase [Crossiella cryophila]|uniref:Putative dinucleotide-binding enzyme n=1 Tax=Crossiella cryophila TaxID=43355 RepID=A0A7W7FT36_9PSEU|nr:NAD(P)-binding domain-containing protein [Crossiella cryophila]MBB4676610.1 putative dinucleotide-binding enzyme [Crossiella cryophila]